MAIAGYRFVTGLLLVVAVVVLAAVPARADADPGKAFHRDVSDAYRHYREAFFYLKRGNAMSAAFELDSLVEKWARVVATHAGAPPAPYAKDARWASTLKEVGAIAEKALEITEAGDAKGAYDLLGPVKDMLADLRRRNGVMLYRDYVEAANAAFRELFKYRRDPPDMEDPEAVKLLRARLDRTIVTYQASLDNAPPEFAKIEQFNRLLTDSLYFLKRIPLAIDRKDATTVINILRRVVSSDDLLWLRFG